MELEVAGAQDVMRDETWKFAIDYIDKKKDVSTSEAVCNGIWNEILRRNFPYPKFIIAPEQRQTTGKRPDLTIFFVDKTNKEWHPVFTFEGKAPYHINKKSMIEDGIAQAADYIPSLSWSNQKWHHEKKKMTYGMLACGKSFMILQYNVENKKLHRIDPSSGTERDDPEISSLDNDAQGFDIFCRGLEKSFII